MKEEIIGKVKLNYSWYSGKDLYSDGDAVENRILEIVRNEEGYEFALDEYRSAREWALSQEHWRGRRRRSTA